MSNSSATLIREWRGTKTLDQFAEGLSQLPLVAISKQAVSQWENGKSVPSFLNLIMVLLFGDSTNSTYAMKLLDVLYPGVVAAIRRFGSNISP